MDPAVTDTSQTGPGVAVGTVIPFTPPVIGSPAAPRRRRLVRVVDATGPETASELPLDLELLKPTPLKRHGTKPEIAVEEPARRRFGHGLWIIFQFLAYFSGVWMRRLLRRSDPAAEARRLREVFERLGGLWVKLGQLLSLRTDVFSPETCYELSRLQHQVRAFPSALAIATVERELGGPISRIFRSFEDHPFAAASISQVHRATMPNHRSVVVKVQRPDAQAAFAADLRFLERIVAFQQVFGVGRKAGLEDALWELNEIMREETDYRYEAANLRRMRKSLKPHGILVPRVYREHSTERVIVMDFMPGVLMSEYIQAKNEDPAAVADWLAENDINPKKVAERLLLSVLRQVLEDNLFHADLHPGNIMLLRDGRIALIDFGTIGRLEPEFLDTYRLTVRAIATRNFTKAADYMLCLCPHLPVVETSSVRRDLVRCYRQWEGRTHLAGIPYFDRAMSSATTEAGRILASHGIHVSWDMMRIGRTFGTLDASLFHLVPDVDFLKFYGKYFADWRRRNGSMAGTLRRIRAGIGEMSDLSHEARAVLAPNLRRQALRLHGVADRFTRVWLLILRWLRIGMLGLSILTVAIWAGQTRPDLLSEDAKIIIKSLSATFPHLSHVKFAGMVLSLMFLSFLLRRISRIMIRY
jgi:ubiquinone biosynthesis protein